MLPRSLLGRTALIIAVMLIVTQAVTLYLFRLYYHGPLVEESAARAASQIGMVVSAMEVLRDEEREEFLDLLESRENIRVLHDPDGVLTTQEPDTAYLQAFGRRLRAALGADTGFFLQSRDARALWVKVPAGRDVLWIGIPRTQIERPFPWWWVGWASVCALLAVAAAFALLHRVVRPLRELAGASKVLAAGGQPARVKVDGPSEIQDVTQAFNGMVADLRQQDEDRAVLLAGISHDLRTPLTRLRLGVELMEGDPSTKADMVRDTEEMDDVLGQFLDFARSGNGEPFVDVSLNELVTRCCAGYLDRGDRVRLSAGQEAPVRVQAVAFQRALVNLIENARKYSSEPVEVMTSRRGDRATVCVLDRGAGIPPDEIDRLMLPFTRLEPARTGAQGAGLGLAIAQRVVREQGGELQLSNRQGGGLEAYIFLPMAPGSLESNGPCDWRS